MIDEPTIQKINTAARIEDVVGDFCTLRKCGNNELTCACPFHIGKKLGHFKVSPKKNMYYCFVCGEGGGPVDFLMKYRDTRMTYPQAMHYLAAKYHIPITDDGGENPVVWVKPVEYNITLPKPEPALQMLELPIELVTARRDTTNNTLCKWLRSLPWNPRQRERLEKVLEAYLVGHAKNGATIFWQVDEEGRVHTGKLMKYNPDGHRDKTYGGNWIHSILEKAGRTDLYDSSKQEMKTCLFGLHLIPVNPRSTVNIVESEKTAIMCSIAYGSENVLWMATGGLQFFREQQLRPLIDLELDIVIHPDHDGVDKWREKMKHINYDHILYSNQFVDAMWIEADGPKADAADIIERKLYERQLPDGCHSLTELLERMATKYPALATLRRTFGLEPIKLKEIEDGTAGT